MIFLSSAQWISFSPMLPWGWLIAVMVITTGLVAWYYARWRSILLRGTWWWLVAAKAVGLIALVAILSNPSWHVTEPDDRAFTVVCLNDASASMGVEDCDGQSRLEAAKRLIGLDHPVGKAVNAYENVRRYLFSDGPPMRVPPTSDYGIQKGRTDVDGALEHLYKRLGADRLGAVLLVTDGIDNVGEPIRNRVQSLVQTGVPITCIGVGNPRPGQDVAIAFDAPPAKIRKGKPFRLQARLDATLSSSRDLQVELFDGARRIRQTTVRLGGDENSATVTFDLTSVLTGLRAYKVHVAPQPGEFNLFNNTDFVGVEVLPPDQYKCLYLSFSPSWDFKYLNALATKEPKLQMSAAIRLAKDNWYRVGFDDDLPNGVPDEERLNAYDCLVLDLTNCEAMTAPEWRRISEFVYRRGGGVIFMGLPSELPESFGSIPPYTVSVPTWTRLGQTPVVVGRTSLLMDASGANETLLGDGLFVPAGAPFPHIRKSELKRAATVGASVDGDDLILLAGHAVGAGKVAFVAIPDTWKWLMTSDSGGDRFAAFWTRIVAWSTAGPKERLVVQPPSSSRSLGERLNLKTNLRTADFLPDNTAKVNAVVTLPDGTIEDVDCYNSPGVDGQYLGRFSPTMPGLHVVRIKVKTTDGESLERQVEYLFSERSGETAPRPMAESVLQNLSRLTGGNYYRWDQCDGGLELPISARIKRIEKQLPLRGYWLFLLTTVLFLIPDWFLRRRTGLR